VSGEVPPVCLPFPAQTAKGDSGPAQQGGPQGPEGAGRAGGRAVGPARPRKHGGGRAGGGFGRGQHQRPQAAERGQVWRQQEEGEVGQAGAFFGGPPGVWSLPRPLGLQGVLYYLPQALHVAGKRPSRGELNAISPGSLLRLHDQLSGKHFLVDTGATYSVFPHWSSAPASGPALTGPGSWPISTWGEMEIPLLFDGQRNFLLAAVQLPILGMDFLRQQGLLVDVGKHQLIMTASMKVIRAVAPHCKKTHFKK
jgi:hypothetical protein